MKEKASSQIVEYEGQILFSLALITAFLMILFKSGVGEVLSLSGSLFILLLMFALFLWNRKKNKLLLAGGIILYLLVSFYWFGQLWTPNRKCTLREIKTPRKHSDQFKLKFKNKSEKGVFHKLDCHF